MTLDQAIVKLRTRNRPVPKPLRLPVEAEVAGMEALLGARFHPDYRRFLLEVSDVVFGTLEPATITDPKSHTFLPVVVTDARAMGVPERLFPICEDNGDYFCLNTRCEVEFWSHDGQSSERWSSLAAWIERVWLRENA